MGTLLDLPGMLARLDDQHLYSLFAEADEQGDSEMAAACNREITRRAELPVETVHELPAFLAKHLPRLFWHQKPVDTGGGGER